MNIQCLFAAGKRHVMSDSIIVISFVKDVKSKMAITKITKILTFSSPVKF